MLHAYLHNNFYCVLGQFSAAKTVFSNTPPSLQDYSVGSSTVASVGVFLASRDEVLAQLRASLQRAQLHMKHHTDIR